ncbi:MAG: hypothetical protein JWO09_2521 [Bacteroidetes bacterium]|nr:hypothetical protein [Bacteroidota bacterium]
MAYELNFRNMKKAFYILAAAFFLLGCKSKLDDVQLNDNPYDHEYAGPKVVRIDSVRRMEVGFHVYATKVSLTSSTEMYQGAILYRNGVAIKTINRTSHASVLTEALYDNTAVAGTAYSYTAALKYDNGKTGQSDAFNFITP